MKPFYPFLIIAILFTSCHCNTSKSYSGQNISESEHLVMATAWFQKSAEMRACYYQAYNLAEFKLIHHLKNYNGEKPTAVILDIDETILDNSPFEKKLIDLGLLYTSEMWKNWTDKKMAKALPAAVEFTQKATELGVQVIYISNRKNDMLESTLKNMQELGFPNTDTHFTYLRTLEKSDDKTKRRQEVMEKYEVLLFIGDNLCDFDQIFADRDSNLGFELVDRFKNDFGEKFIILPNPMYGEWEKAIYENDYSLPTEQKRNLRKQILTGY